MVLRRSRGGGRFPTSEVPLYFVSAALNPTSETRKHILHELSVLDTLKLDVYHMWGGRLPHETRRIQWQP